MALAQSWPPAEVSSWGERKESERVRRCAGGIICSAAQQAPSLHSTPLHPALTHPAARVLCWRGGEGEGVQCGERAPSGGGGG
eukprot:2603481-Rhodomonas_salina.1